MGVIGKFDGGWQRQRGMLAGRGQKRATENNEREKEIVREKREGERTANIAHHTANTRAERITRGWDR